MKSAPLALGCLGLLILSGCAASANLHTAMADRARRSMAEHCEIGRVHAGNPTVRWSVRVAKGTTVEPHLLLTVTGKRAIDPRRITIYSLKEHAGGWVEADASTGPVRDTFYFNQNSSAVACSFHAWRGPSRINIPLSSKARPTMNSVTGN